MGELMKRTAIVTVLLLAVALPAWAAEFTVSFESARREHHGPVPAVVQVAAMQVPPDMVGLSCDATFTAVNNDSLHDTDLIVDTNGSLQVVADVESGAATVREVGPVTLGQSVVLSLRMNEHNARGFAVSSLGGSVTFDCQEPPSSTTTTQPTTTSSVPSSSTTTTTPLNTTTTSITSSSSTSTSTTNPAPTTTAPTPSSTVYPDPTDPPPVSETLPETGIETGHLAAIAVIALLAGGGLVAMTPKQD